MTLLKWYYKSKHLPNLRNSLTAYIYTRSLPIFWLIEENNVCSRVIQIQYIFVGLSPFPKPPHTYSDVYNIIVLLLQIYKKMFFVIIVINF